MTDRVRRSRRALTFARNLSAWALAAGAAAAAAPAGGSPPPQETPRWHPFELELDGPPASQTQTSPNPFLDRRLAVTFTAPSGREIVVQGFFDGDGAGGPSGSSWKVRFAPDEIGTWQWQASFRKGANVAISLDPLAGTPTAFDGQSGSFVVTPEPADAPGFLGKGWLRWSGGHYLRFQDGTYFLKGGTDSPENLLAFRGFDGVESQGGVGIVHEYGPHVGDWQPGDPSVGTPSWPNGLKGIVGALNYLSSVGVNSVYFLPMNLGGDGQDTWPFVGPDKSSFDKTHYHVSRLAQWNEVFEHATRKGILLHFVLGETEWENEHWLDEGGFGVERKLFFRELVARFAHNLAIKWNLSEENNFPIWQLEQMASYLRAIDPYDHPIAVHTHPNDTSDYPFLVGNPDFDATSIQYDPNLAGQFVEEWRAKSAAAGRPWVLDMDENMPAWDGLSDSNAGELRRRTLWDVYLSGGQVEWYGGAHPLPVGGDQSIEDFRTREEMWNYMRYAREFLEALPFWAMEPADELLTGESWSWEYGGGEVFAREGEVYAIYLPDASQTGTLDLAVPGTYELRWYDPRNGVFAGAEKTLGGGGPISLGPPPSHPGQDWVALVERVALFASSSQISVSSGQPQVLLLDAGPALAGEPYLVLGSLTGTSPAITFGGLQVDVALDHWTVGAILAAPGTFHLGYFGHLDASGRALAAFHPAAKLGSSAVGLDAWHAFVTGSPPVLASKPVQVTVVP